MPQQLLVNLPDSLRSLSLFVPSWLRLDPLNSILARLEEFWLYDWEEEARGHRSQIISRLSSVRHLTINPLAVADLSVDLLPLKNLTRLHIMGCDIQDHHEMLDADEVARFLSKANLKRLSADCDATEHWGWFDVVGVKEAARRKNVVLGGVLELDNDFWMTDADKMFLEEEFGAFDCGCGEDH